MISYDYIKERFEDNKSKIVYGLCLVLMYGVGYGSARVGEQPSKKDSNQYQNYTTSTTVKKEDAAEPKRTSTPTTDKETRPAADAADCTKIKGNIGSNGSRIYHVPGGSFYDRVKAEICFSTESEAESLGFKKSSK